LAGSDIITAHAEVLDGNSVSRLSEAVREKGRKFGMALKPSTPVPSWFKEYATEIDLVLILSVNPGFPVQRFMPEVLPKVQKVLKVAESPDLDVEVDGGVDHENAATIIKSGATILVAGASIFRRADVKSSLREMRAIAERAFQEVSPRC
jgi:ribulose-phosphate 3-epimerase